MFGHRSITKEGLLLLVLQEDRSATYAVVYVVVREECPQPLPWDRDKAHCCPNDAVRERSAKFAENPPSLTPLLQRVGPEAFESIASKWCLRLWSLSSHECLQPN
ncbi:unnamed protein product [Ostreobium quekettii]|uniref:Uncharacterized protein n=1 Tax=Ostreobium quekettii TaxID=121088 RepID=A0A8S1IZ09_9CHLO|nr:unnamed protein product [Ostreobium quekettii]